MFSSLSLHLWLICACPSGETPFPTAYLWCHASLTVCPVHVHYALCKQTSLCFFYNPVAFEPDLQEHPSSYDLGFLCHFLCVSLTFALGRIKIAAAQHHIRRKTMLLYWSVCCFVYHCLSGLNLTQNMPGSYLNQKSKKDDFFAQGLHLKSQQRCSAGIRTWLSADQSNSSTLTESSFMFDPCLIHRGTVMLEEKRVLSKLLL